MQERGNDKSGFRSTADLLCPETFSYQKPPTWVKGTVFQGPLDNIKLFVQDRGAARSSEDMMIGEAMQRHLGTSCKLPPLGTLLMLTLRGSEGIEEGLEKARASNRTLGTMHKLLPKSMRALHRQLSIRTRQWA